MARLVTDPDGRRWVVRARMMLTSRPAVQVGATDAVLRVLLLGVAGVLGLVVVLSTPATLTLPAALTATLVVVAAMGLGWWAVRRPWQVSATQAGTEGSQLSTVVRGPWSAQHAVRALAEQVGATDREWSEPDPTRQPFLR